MISFNEANAGFVFGIEAMAGVPVWLAAVGEACAKETNEYSEEPMNTKGLDSRIRLEVKLRFKP